MGKVQKTATPPNSRDATGSSGSTQRRVTSEAQGTFIDAGYGSLPPNPAAPGHRWALPPDRRPPRATRSQGGPVSHPHRPAQTHLDVVLAFCGWRSLSSLCAEGVGD